MAVDDDIIRKNPFKFKMADILPDDAYVRDALSKEQQIQYLQAIRDDNAGNYYDDIVILLETGLRVSGIVWTDKIGCQLRAALYLYPASVVPNRGSTIFHYTAKDQERYPNHSFDGHRVSITKARRERASCSQS